MKIKEVEIYRELVQSALPKGVEIEIERVHLASLGNFDFNIYHLGCLVAYVDFRPEEVRVMIDSESDLKILNVSDPEFHNKLTEVLNRVPQKFV